MQKSYRALLKFDPFIGYRFIPNQYKRYQLDREFVVQTNSLGFRSDYEYLPKKSPGKFRVIAVGDSYLAGDGISNNQRFGDLLEQSTNIELINLGLPGSGNDQQLLILKHIVNNWEFDALLIAPYLHDIHRNLVDYSRVISNYDINSNEYQNCIRKPHYVVIDGKLNLLNQPPERTPKFVENAPIPGGPTFGIFNLTNKFFPKVLNSSIAQKITTRLYDLKRLITFKYLKKQSDAVYSTNNEAWTLMKLLIKDMIKIANGRKVFILPFPHYNNIVFGEDPIYLKRFKELEADNVHVLDMLGVFRNEKVKNLKSYYNKYDGHFNAAANEKIANWLKPILTNYSSQVVNVSPKYIKENEKRDTLILGISCYYHDSAAALIKNGEIVAAVQEERFTRIKHDKSFPLNSINYCLEEARVSIDNVDSIVYYDNPYLSIERSLVNFIVSDKKSRVNFEKLTHWGLSKLSLKRDIERQLGYKGKVVTSQHHRSHAASAFFPSPFKRAAILVVDGVGEWACSSIGIGENDRIRILKEQLYPHSLGLLYSTITAFCGFKVNSGEYKLMGLAPYGVGKFKDRILDKLIVLNDDGSFELNLEYFDFMSGERMFSDKMSQLFEVSPRVPESRISQVYMDIGKSIQEALEVILLKMINYVKNLTNEDYIVLAGGVALNCVANGKILRSGIFKDIWIQPAAGDAGGALGAALDYYYEYLNQGGRKINSIRNQVGYLYGPSFSNSEIESFLEWRNAVYKFYPENKYNIIARHLANGSVVGFFSGRMEFGPRALGARSIIADPRSEQMQSKLNLKIKFRESFRPFAPIVIEDDVSKYFDLDRPSPYMLIVADVLKNRRLDIEETVNDSEDLLKRVNIPKSDIPSVTHIDYSARIQTLTEYQNPDLFKVIEEFKRITGYGLLINTSFNVRSEPIVCTPEDAYRCFLRTGMDVLVLGDFILEKESQPKFEESEDWKSNYELD